MLKANSVLRGSCTLPSIADVRRQVRHLPLHQMAAYELLGHRSDISALEVHPSAQLALTLDEDGAGLLWGCAILAPEFRIPTSSPQVCFCLTTYHFP